MTTLESARARVRRAYDLAFAPGSGRIALGSDAQISPTGDLVVFTGTIVDDLDRGGHTRVCAAEPSGPRVVADGAGNQWHARWSPDGSRIALLSDGVGSGLAQLVILDPRAAALTGTPTIPAIVQSLAWSGDGRRILLVAAGLDADLGDTQGPGLAPLPASTWTPKVRSTLPAGKRRELWVHDLAEGQTTQVDVPGFTVWEATWCGTDGVAAVVSQGWTEGAWFDSELHLLPLSGGTGTRLYKGTAQLACPSANRSATTVTCIEGLASDRGNVAGCLIAVDLATGVKSRLDTSCVEVTDSGWISDDTVGFIGLRGVETVAGSAVLGSDARAAETWRDRGSCGRHVPQASFNKAGAMAVIRDSFVDYAAILVVDADGGARSQSLGNQGTAQLSGVGIAEEVRWQAPDGETIEGILCRPPGAPPYPMILHVHGGPVGANTSAWHMQNDTTRHLVAAGFAVLHPNPRGSLGRGQRFAQLVLQDMGGADTWDHLSGVEEMIRTGKADPSRIGVAGTSYGGYMANWLPTQCDLFRAAVAMSPVTDWASLYYTSNIPEFVTLFMGTAPATDPRAYHDRSPISFADRVTARTLETAGALDLSTPAEQAVRFFNAMRLSGGTAELVLYPEEGHGMGSIPATMDLCARVLAWFETHLHQDPSSVVSP